MQLAEPQLVSHNFPFPELDLYPEPPSPAVAAELSLSEMRIDDLREALRKNEINFPSQIPTFAKRDRPDLQRKLVQLYFVCGWSAPKIGKRYGLTRVRVQQILNTWKRRAVDLGYVQAVPPPAAFPRAATGSPIRVVLSAVLRSASALDIELSAPPPAVSAALSGRREASPSNQARPKLTATEIEGVLDHLEAGRTVTEMAAAMGVPDDTIRLWQEQREIQMLRQENAGLKKLLSELGLNGIPLIHSIRKSYGLSA